MGTGNQICRAVRKSGFKNRQNDCGYFLNRENRVKVTAFIVLLIAYKYSNYSQFVVKETNVQVPAAVPYVVGFSLILLTFCDICNCS